MRCLSAILAVLFHAAWVAPAAPYESAVVFKDFTGERPLAYRTVLRFDAEQLLVDTSMFAPRGASVFAYRTDLRKAWHVDHAEQSFVEVDERMASGMTDGVYAALDLMGDMMRRAGMRLDEKPTVVTEALEERRTMLGMPCVRYRVRRGEQKMQDVWLASWPDAGIPAEAFGAVRMLSAASARMLSLLAASPLARGLPRIPLDQVAALDGYPVLLRQYDAEGRVLYDIILGAPEEQAAGMEPFQVPASYKRTLY